MPATLTETILTVDGIRSPILQAGSPHAGEAVMFIHGNPGSSQDWARLVERTGAFARAVAWDHPGFGQADKPAGFDYTVQGYAAHLGRCLEALGITRAHLVLHDFGGPWGMAWAAVHPAAFASATLLNIGVLPGYRWHYLARIWRTPLLGELVRATTTRTAFGLLLRHGNPRRLPRAFVDRMYADLDGGTKRTILALYRATDDPAGASVRLGAALGPLDRPTLVIWGAATTPTCRSPWPRGSARSSPAPTWRSSTTADTGHSSTTRRRPSGWCWSSLVRSSVPDRRAAAGWPREDDPNLT
jgi:pimeloyl-ACP methyl ester carboxylesterase